MHESPNKRKKSHFGDSYRGSPRNTKRPLGQSRRGPQSSINSLTESECGSSGETECSSCGDPCATWSKATSPASNPSTPMASRDRSLSIDSVPDRTLLWSMPPHKDAKPSQTQTTEGIVINPNCRLTGPVYHDFHHEVEETGNLFVPGETQSRYGGLPVRFLNNFAVYDENRMYLPFSHVVVTLLTTISRPISASGVVSRCLEDFEDNESDIAEEETQLPVTLQPLRDFWTDYNTHRIDGIWGARTVAVATVHAWYILRQPAPLYAMYYQPFWLAHHLTWLAAKAVRKDIRITFKEFCRQVERMDDHEAVLILGRNLTKKDLTGDYTTLYIKDQFSCRQSVEDTQILLKSPLLQHIVRHASAIGRTMHDFLCLEDFTGTIDVEFNKKKCAIPGESLTVTMPLVHELATGLFLKTLLKAGKTLDEQDSGHRLIQQPEPPDILHPDHPTNIEWEAPVSGLPGYFNQVSLDGESYTVGDVVMVNPGEDDLPHRSKCALEACSQSRNNELCNKVWFCRIIYMFEKSASSKDQIVEPTAHVQWYEHGSKTILQETAHPYGLFALLECTDIPIGSILGPCVVRHLKPGDEEPHDYHCSFLWDPDENRFLNQSILKHIAPARGHLRCPSCTFNQERYRQAVHETFLHSETLAEIQGIVYHKNDFVYIAAKPNKPYLIGQIRRFIVHRKLTLGNSMVELTLLGRFDDVARAVGGPGIEQDETRLFLTDQVNSFPISLVEGKCFVHKKSHVTSQNLADHFYVDQWAVGLDIRCLSDLVPIEGQRLVVCKPCNHTEQNKQDRVRAYKACNPPLRTMELFAGAGGLSTGLEQSGYVKTSWAVEILPGAAATFQANHPEAIVYNQDTNLCLQNAIHVRESKTRKPLKDVTNGKQLPPMPQRGDVDLIAGGFPCQSFSGMNHQRHKSHEDVRTTLVANMLSFVEFYEPRYVLMENVKGLLQFHSRGATSDFQEEDEDNVNRMSIVKFVLRALLRLGYQTQFKVLQAADYGSPQRRERVIFWAAQRSELLPEYPLPTHVAPNHKSHTISLPTYGKLSPVLRSDNNCAPFRALVIADAISDLPGFDWENPHTIYSEDESEAEETLRRRKRYQQLSAVSTPSRTLTGFLEPVGYATSPKTRYQRMLRGDNEQVTLHCSRTFRAPVVERVWHICSHNVRGPYDLPRELWTPALRKASENESKLYKKWQGQFGRLKWKDPFYTALTSCRPFSKGSKVLHPKQKRILTARECARSQGFPDSYQFVQMDGDDEPAAWAKLLDEIHKQIGNAVPIPLGHALGESLGKALVSQWLRETCEATLDTSDTSSLKSKGPQ